MTPIRTVAVAGGSGLLGRHIVAALCRAKFHVTVLTRSGSSAAVSRTSKRIEVDYSSEASILKVLQGIDALVICVTSNAVQVQPLLFDSAVKAGVKHIIPSEYGVIQHDAKARLNPAIKPVTDLQELLQDKEREGGFTYTIVACGAFLQWTVNTPLVLEWEKHSVSRWDGGNEPLSSTRLQTVGSAVAKVLQDTASHRNRVVKIHETVITQNKWLELAKRTDPFVQWSVVNVDSEQILAERMTELQKPENQAAEVLSEVNMGVLVALTWGRNYTTAFTDVENDRLGIKMMSDSEIEDIIAQRMKGKMYEEAVDES